MDSSTFGWGLLLGPIFRVSLLCFEGDIFWLAVCDVSLAFFCCFMGIEGISPTVVVDPSAFR